MTDNPLERRVLIRVRRFAGAGVMPTAKTIKGTGRYAMAEDAFTIRRVMDRLVKRGLLRIGPMQGKARTWFPVKEQQ
jgi:hypothetical protein